MWRRVLLVVLVAALFKFSTDYFNLNELFLQEVDEIQQDTQNQNEETKNKINILKADFFDQKPADNKLYLSILGNVYDVTKGEKHYKPGASYDFFVGRDASRAYVTGDFKNDLNDKVDDLTDSQIADIFRWKEFYDTTYTFVGLIEGRFYDSIGQKTPYFEQLELKLQNHKEVEHKNSKFSQRFPMCNSEWTQEKGLVKVWCTRESGGFKRSWVGYPRLVYNPNSKVESCACVNDEDLKHPNVKEYIGCPSKDPICNYPKK